MISPLAYVDPTAKLGKDVTIRPFAYIDANVEIGDNCEIMPYASIMTGTRIGNNCKVYQGAIVGADPQDFRWKGTPSFCFIGNDVVIRENVIINRGIYSQGGTRIGDHCFIMAESHIGHDTHIVGRNVIGNGATIAGDAVIGEGSILSSNAIRYCQRKSQDGALCCPQRRHTRFFKRTAIRNHRPQPRDILWRQCHRDAQGRTLHRRRYRRCCKSVPTRLPMLYHSIQRAQTH